MSDRIVVITGATGMLGPIVSRRFAEDGARLALLARREESCVAHTRPDEIAAAVAWLCSPEAGAVNGQRIPLVGRS